MLIWDNSNYAYMVIGYVGYKVYLRGFPYLDSLGVLDS